GMCVTNLLSNAKQHGVPPIRLTVSVVAQTLRIEVEDCGEFPSFYQRLCKRLSRHQDTHSRPNTDNMGVGLQLVRKLITQMGGKLVIRRHPTRCILELPL
ncbi:sensor histidine kinase, partial [Vibrio cholerae]